MSFALKFKKYFPSILKSYRSRKDEMNIIENRIKELKSSSNFLEDFHKPKTNVVYSNDLLFQNNFSEQFLNHPKIKQNSIELQRISRGKKLIDNNFLEFIKSIEKEKFSNLDLIILYETSIAASLSVMNYKITSETLNKVYAQLKDYSTYDTLYISAKMDEALISFRNSNNLQEIKNLLIEQIAKAKIINQPHLVVKGLLNLAQIYLSISDYAMARIFSQMGIKIYNTQKINDEYLYRKVLTMQASNLGERKFLKKLKNFDEEMKEIVMSDYYTSYLKNVNPTNPKSIYKRWILINQLLDKVNSRNDPQHPALVVLLMHKWILTYKLGRESTSNFYFEKAKNSITSNPLLDENFLFRYYILAISEASNMELPADQIFGIFKKVIPPNKLCFDLLLYRTFSLYYSVTRGDEKETVVSKYNELSKLNESYFGTVDSESMAVLGKKLQDIGYI